MLDTDDPYVDGVHHRKEAVEPVVSHSILPGVYQGRDLLRFSRNHTPNAPFGSKREDLRYVRCSMDFLLLHPTGNVVVRIWKPARECRWGAYEWQNVNLEGKLVQCRRQGAEVELLLENCGKFFIRSGARPTPVDF
jgi:hypothetical protein